MTYKGLLGKTTDSVLSCTLYQLTPPNTDRSCRKQMGNLTRMLSIVFIVLWTTYCEVLCTHGNLEYHHLLRAAHSDEQPLRGSQLYIFRGLVVLRELSGGTLFHPLCPCLLYRLSHESMEYCCTGLPARGPQAEGINEHRTER